jgi:hypothetical protein
MTISRMRNMLSNKTLAVFLVLAIVLSITAQFYSVQDWQG